MAMIKTRKRLSSGEKTLDEMLGGGFIEGNATLINGAPGVGKSTLGLQFLCEGAEHGETGILVSFEEFPATLIRDAKSLGWDLQKYQDAELLRIIFTSPEIFLSSLQSPDSPFAETVRALMPTRVVIDSISQFERVTQDPLKLRNSYNELVNALKRDGLTALLISEDARVTHNKDTSLSSLLYVVDSVLLLRYIEVDSTMRRILAILKMRGSQHSKEIRGYTIGVGGLALQEPLDNIQGLLSGITQRMK